VPFGMRDVFAALLYRQSEIYARQGAGTLDAGRLGGRKQSLTGTAGDSAGWLCEASAKLHADDTPVPVLFPGNGKTKTGRLWT
jgi:hypothetical protein